METNITKGELSNYKKMLSLLKGQQETITKVALQDIKEILMECENNEFVITDKGDDDENFLINVSDGTDMLVRSVALVDNNIVLRTYCHAYYICETNKTALDVYDYLINELSYDLQSENEQ